MNSSPINRASKASLHAGSNNIKHEFEHVFDRLVESYVAHSTNNNQGLLTYFDEDWLSPCIALHNKPENLQAEALVNWQPVLRVANASNTDLKPACLPDLTNLEKALEVSLPIQMHTLFCRYFSHDLNAIAEQGPLTLLQAWNEQDFDRLQKNIISHVLMKRRLKQADTVFFALTDKDDLLLSILVGTGEVVLEVAGKEPHQVISPNLSEFIASLKPQPQLVNL